MKNVEFSARVMEFNKSNYTCHSRVGGNDGSKRLKTHPTSHPEGGTTEGTYTVIQEQ